MHEIPPKSGKYVVFDTETTGLRENEDHIIEIGAHEIHNGKLTGKQFHIYLRPRKEMSDEVVDIHKIHNDFYDLYFKDIYISDKENLLNFLKFIQGSSLLLAHNASFDMMMLNRELAFWGLRQIPTNKFRCTMRIFHDIYFDVSRGSVKFKRLAECCEIVGLKGRAEDYHNALYDSEMTAKLMCRLFEIVEERKGLNFWKAGRRMTDMEHYARNNLYNLESEMKWRFYLLKGNSKDSNNSNLSLNQIETNSKTSSKIDEKDNINDMENINSDEAKIFSPEDIDDIIKELV